MKAKNLDPTLQGRARSCLPCLPKLEARLPQGLIQVLAQRASGQPGPGASGQSASAPHFPACPHHSRPCPPHLPEPSTFIHVLAAQAPGVASWAEPGE